MTSEFLPQILTAAAAIIFLVALAVRLTRRRPLTRIYKESAR